MKQAMNITITTAVSFIISIGFTANDIGILCVSGRYTMAISLTNSIVVKAPTP